jgi:hypothetical protein
MKIRTDRKWKNFRYGYELPKKALKEFDWLEDAENQDGFMYYRRRWYHIEEFMRIDSHTPDAFQKWHGYAADSYFSGILLRVSNDGEQYQIGTYFS